MLSLWQNHLFNHAMEFQHPECKNSFLQQSHAAGLWNDVHGDVIADLTMFSGSPPILNCLVIILRQLYVIPCVCDSVFRFYSNLNDDSLSELLFPNTTIVLFKLKADVHALKSPLTTRRAHMSHNFV